MHPAKPAKFGSLRLAADPGLWPEKLHTRKTAYTILPDNEGLGVQGQFMFKF